MPHEETMRPRYLAMSLATRERPVLPRVEQKGWPLLGKCIFPAVARARKSVLIQGPGI